jgi:carboxyl-terminal processing protease
MNPRLRLLIALASTSLIAYVAVGSLLGRVLGDTSYGQLAVFNEVMRLVIDGYVEPVNVDRSMAGARLGLMDALDGDSAYLDAEELQAYQQGRKETDAEVGLLLTRRFTFLMVVSARPGSPAEKAGLRPGDVIKTIDGRHTRPLPVPVGERLLRGAPGSVVKLSVLRPSSDPVDFSLVRERPVPLLPKGRMLEDGVGLLRVPELGPRTADEARSEIEGLKRSGAQRLVLDLRGAAFGAPAEAVKLAELFLKGGVVARLVGRKSADQLLTADPSKTLWTQPMAALVDDGTAGPGELVAAALRDAERCPIVGERTFGRAAVQKAFPLPEGGLLLTVARYQSPKGTLVHGKGVEPTVAVAAPEPGVPGAEGAPADPILEKALELLKVEVKKAA